MKTPTATERLIVFRGRKYLAARSLSDSLWMHAIIGRGEDGNGRWDRLSLSITAPKMRASEPKFMGSGGPIEGAGIEGEREGTIANLRCLVWSIAAERRVPRLGMRSREGGGSEQQAVERSGGREREEALYSREFERDRKAGRGDWLFRMQMVMTRDDDDGAAAGLERRRCQYVGAATAAAAAVAATQAPLPNDVSLSPRRREERAIHP